MLTSADLDCIPINQEVLNLIPEVFAWRNSVLPVKLLDDRLHVVLPNDADDKVEELVCDFGIHGKSQSVVRFS